MIQSLSRVRLIFYFRPAFRRHWNPHICNPSTLSEHNRYLSQHSNVQYHHPPRWALHVLLTIRHHYIQSQTSPYLIFTRTSATSIASLPYTSHKRCGTSSSFSILGFSSVDGIAVPLDFVLLQDLATRSLARDTLEHAHSRVPFFGARSLRVTNGGAVLGRTGEDEGRCLQRSAAVLAGGLTLIMSTSVSLRGCLMYECLPLLVVRVIESTSLSF